MPRLPDVLTATDLPETELRAMRLDGEVYPLVGAWCALDTPVTPAVRARAVLAARSPRLVAELGAAAWIWGVAPLLPRPLTFCVDVHARARLRPNPDAVVRELVLADEDIADLDGCRVTTPLRTAIDLARSRQGDAPMLTALAAIGGFDREAAFTALRRRGALAGVQNARAALSAALS